MIQVILVTILVMGAIAGETFVITITSGLPWRPEWHYRQVGWAIRRNIGRILLAILLLIPTEGIGLRIGWITEFHLRFVHGLVAKVAAELILLAPILLAVICWIVGKKGDKYHVVLGAIGGFLIAFEVIRAYGALIHLGYL